MLSSRLCNDRRHHLAEYIGQPVVAPLMLVGEPLMVDAQEVKDRRVEVVDMDAVTGDAVAERIGRAVDGPRLDAAAGAPDSETARVMIAAIVGGRQLPLAIIGAAELATPEHQSVVEHAALLQVDDQGRTGLVGLATELADTARQAAMMVPARVIELNESNVALGEPRASRQLAANVPGRRESGP